MGAIMSEPDTKCNMDNGQSADIFWSCVSMQGWRIDMEDDHIIQPDFTEDLALFAIYDGHGGSEIAKTASKLYPAFLKDDQYFKKGDYARALVSSFERFDLFMMNENSSSIFGKIAGSEICAGCTALVMLIEKKAHNKRGEEELEVKLNSMKDMNLRVPASQWKAHVTQISDTLFQQDKTSPEEPEKKRRVWIANSGDCRSLLIRSKLETLSINEEHKPTNKREKTRILKAGGLIINNRIDENLNLSRALGDFHYKSNRSLDFDKQMIISKPDIYEIFIDSGKDEYLFLGCDGVFERLSDMQIGNIMMTGQGKQLGQPIKPQLESDDEENNSLLDEMKKLISQENQEEKETEEDSNEENSQQKYVPLDKSTNLTEELKEEAIEEENVEEARIEPGERNSAQSFKSSSENSSEKELKANLSNEAQSLNSPVKEETGQEDLEKKLNEDFLEEMTLNVKQVLMRTVAKKGENTFGMGYDNMSAICVRLSGLDKKVN